MKPYRVFVTALLLLTTLVAGPASAQTESVLVTTVLVNRLGGVSVVGQVDCSGIAESIRAGGYTVSDEYGEPTEVTWTEGDSIIILTNPDQYTVSQPSGKKTTIRVTHESSRATPCYTDLTAFVDGTPIACVPGEPCTWVTDQFGYRASVFGPLYDYSSNGKFKTGLLNVSGHSSGAYITIVHETNPVTWSDYADGEGFYVSYNQVLKAASGR